MAEFTYTTVPGKVGGLLDRIRETGVPQARVTLEWLKSIGFKSSNDRSLIRVLDQIGFLDSSGLPSDSWRSYRGANHGSVLAGAIQAGYAELYATYPDAHNRSQSDLESFFSTHTSSGKQVIVRMVATFKALCQRADFGAFEAGVITPGFPDGTAVTDIKSRPQESGTGVVININVQLTLPETTDEDVYDSFFRAMRRHLISEPET